MPSDQASNLSIQEPIVTHVFLALLSCPMLLLGRGLMYKLGSRFALRKEEDGMFSLTLGEQNLYPDIPFDIWKEVKPQVWDCDVPGWDLKAQPLKVTLKDPTARPYKRQYVSKPEAKARLHPLIDKFLKHILKPCQSLYNTPILPIKKAKWRILNGARSKGHK